MLYTVLHIDDCKFCKKHMHLAALLVVCHWLLVGQIGQMDKMDLMSEAVHLAASLSSACNMAMTSPFICRTDVGQIPEANGDQQGAKKRTSRANRTRKAIRTTHTNISWSTIRHQKTVLKQIQHLAMIMILPFDCVRLRGYVIEQCYWTNTMTSNSYYIIIHH